jgi:lysophospholipase L1-like esterase
MDSMKNARYKKASQPRKRQRSKYKVVLPKRTKLGLVGLLVLLCLAVVTILTAIATDVLKISIVQVGLPLGEGVYEVSLAGRDFLAWDSADESDFVGRYQIDYNSSGEYTIRNVYSNLILTGVIDDDTNGLTYKLATLDETCSQKWLMSFEDSGNKLISTCNVMAESQVLQFRAVGGPAKLPSPAKQTIANGMYAFVPSSNPQGVLENAAGPSLQVVEKDNSPKQLFEIIYNESGYYSIYNLDLELQLDIAGGGDLLLAQENKRYCGQDWAIVENKGVYRIISSCTGYVLGALDGVNVGTVPTADSEAVLWQIEQRRTVLFVGDSITYGQTSCNYNSNYCRTVSTNAVNTEMSILNREAVNYVEINMGNPGATASGYLYGIDQAYLNKVRQYRIEIAQVMLGTNDSARGVSMANYTKNISGIIDELVGSGVKTVILNRPIYNAVAPRLLVGYFEGLSGLANNETVFMGDTQGYDWFRQNSWHLDGSGGGFHPDQEGYRVLGELWATAFKAVVEN